MNKVFGHAVVEGLSIPIVGFRLSDGRLWFLARVWGPFPAINATTVTIFGEDGRGFTQTDARMVWNEVMPGQELVIHFGFNILYTENLCPL